MGDEPKWNIWENWQKHHGEHYYAEWMKWEAEQVRRQGGGVIKSSSWFGEDLKAVVYAAPFGILLGLGAVFGFFNTFYPTASQQPPAKISLEERVAEKPQPVSILPTAVAQTTNQEKTGQSPEKPVEETEQKPIAAKPSTLAEALGAEKTIVIKESSPRIERPVFKKTPVIEALPAKPVYTNPDIARLNVELAGLPARILPYTEYHAVETVMKKYEAVEKKYSYDVTAWAAAKKAHASFLEENAEVIKKAKEYHLHNLACNAAQQVHSFKTKISRGLYTEKDEEKIKLNYSSLKSDLELLNKSYGGKDMHIDELLELAGKDLQRAYSEKVERLYSSKPIQERPAKSFAAKVLSRLHSFFA